MSEQATQDKAKAPEVDLSQFATVSVVKRAVSRPAGARKLDNPFESIVRQSYETAWTDEDGTEHEHGEPRLTAPVRADSDEEKAIVRALTRAGRHVGVSVEKEFTDRDAEGNKIRKPNRAILFSAVPLKKREKKNGNGAQASTQPDEQGAPAEGGQSDSTGMTGEQEGVPEAPGEQDNPTVVPDEQPADQGDQQPAWS
jgi:hypothetical protein